jgi:hypothetical protein
MLQKAVELEVTEFLGRDHYQRRGEEVVQGYRNGYEDKLVQTAERPLPLKMVDASAGWRGVKTTRAITRELDSLKTDSTPKPAVRLAA